ncbi:MAG: DUF4440 domain-containing protein [Flavobacteriaceae bacterium]|nr:MAG: DUF4440 domain-containing protein [Flavobacteriaceae bacterium]
MPSRKIEKSSVNDIKEITEVLNQSALDWSNGDLEAYMNAYWKSPDLKFIGSRGVTYGWQQTLDNYKKGYPSSDHTGTLTFDLIHVDFLAPEVYSVIGKYHLERPVGEANGIFTLVFKRIAGKWKIVIDHSE